MDPPRDKAVGATDKIGVCGSFAKFNSTLCFVASGADRGERAGQQRIDRAIDAAVLENIPRPHLGRRPHRRSQFVDEIILHGLGPMSIRLRQVPDDFEAPVMVDGMQLSTVSKADVVWRLTRPGRCDLAMRSKFR